jgi:hypothetical protein
MKKIHHRKPRPAAPKLAANPAVQRQDPYEQSGAAQHGHPHGHHEKKVGVVSGTPADAFDENSERKHDKWVAIYISVLAVLLAIAATGSNDAMKTAQQAGFQVNDQFAYYQAKYIRQSQIRLASDELELKMQETPSLPEPALKLLQSKKSDYDKEAVRLESDGKHGKKELLAKAESCENERNLALAQHPFYDYSMAMLQIAIVLASASIITGTRLLLGVSGGVGLFAVLLFLNGYSLVYGAPFLKHDKADALEKAGIHISLKCIEE